MTAPRSARDERANRALGRVLRDRSRDADAFALQAGLLALHRPRDRARHHLLPGLTDRYPRWQDGAVEWRLERQRWFGLKRPVQALPEPWRPERAPEARRALRSVAPIGPPAGSRSPRRGDGHGRRRLLRDARPCSMRERERALLGTWSPSEAQRPAGPRPGSEALAGGRRVPRRRRLHRPVHPRDDGRDAGPARARVRDRAGGRRRARGEPAPQRRGRSGGRPP